MLAATQKLYVIWKIVIQSVNTDPPNVNTSHYKISKKNHIPYFIRKVFNFGEAVKLTVAGTSFLKL